MPLTIDGMPLRTVEDAFTAYDSLRDGQEWSLKVKRGRSSVTLDYKVY